MEEGGGHKWHPRALSQQLERYYQPLIWDQVKMFLATLGGVEGVGPALSMSMVVAAVALGLWVL